MIFFDYHGHFWDLWREIQNTKIEDCIVVDMNNHPVICGFAALALYFAQRNVIIYLYNVGEVCDKVKDYIEKADPCNLYVFEDKPDFLGGSENGTAILD